MGDSINGIRHFNELLIFALMMMMMMMMMMMIVVASTCCSFLLFFSNCCCFFFSFPIVYLFYFGDISRSHGSPQSYSASVIAVGHECDLALLSVADESFWHFVGNPMPFGELPELHDEVSIFFCFVLFLLVYVLLFKLMSVFTSG